jgi:hypothetical protein
MITSLIAPRSATTSEIEVLITEARERAGAAA